MANIYPSLIAADQLNLAHVITQLDPYVIGYHLDIMDNHFVPNLTWGSLVVNAITNLTKRQLWVHMMVDNPQKWIEILTLPADSIFTFHFEAMGQNINFIKQIKEKKWKASIAINPKTDIEHIFPLLDQIDQVLIMSVEPGFSGQPFINSVVDKIDPLIGYRQTKGLNFSIAMDGGIKKNNIKQLAEKGVDDFAVASAIFEQTDQIAAVEELKKLVG